MRVLGLLAMLLALAAAQSAAAADWLRPDVAYSATRTVRMGDTMYSGLYAYDHGKERFEVTRQGRHLIFIQRPDLDRSYVITVDEGVCQIMGFDWGNLGVPPVAAEEEPLIQEIGRMRMNGEEVTKYELTVPQIRKWFWRTHDGIPLRIVGRGEGEKAYVQVDFELTDLERGPQPAALFEPPPGIQMIINPVQ